MKEEIKEQTMEEKNEVVPTEGRKEGRKERPRDNAAKVCRDRAIWS